MVQDAALNRAGFDPISRFGGPDTCLKYDFWMISSCITFKPIFMK